MTTVSFYSVTVSADAPAALCRLVRQFDARGLMPPAHSLPRALRRNLGCRGSVRRSPHFGVHRPHPWRAPVWWTLKSHRSGQRSSLVAGYPELPRAVSGCFVPAATFIPRPGDQVPPADALRATSAKRAPRWSETERGGWRLIATTNASTLRPSSVRVKSRCSRCSRCVAMSKRCSRCCSACQDVDCGSVRADRRCRRPGLPQVASLPRC
jgi:hypothetical protein